MRSLLLCALLFSSHALAGMMVHDVRAHATFKFANTGAVYLELMNHGDAADQLVAVSVASDVASSVEVHETLIEGEMAKMREIALPMPIEPHQTIEFVPRGKHIMLMGLAKALEAGQYFDLVLEFAKAGQVEARVKVVEAGESNQDDHSHHHQHD